MANAEALADAALYWKAQLHNITYKKEFQKKKEEKRALKLKQMMTPPPTTNLEHIQLEDLPLVHNLDLDNAIEQPSPILFELAKKQVRYLKLPPHFKVLCKDRMQRKDWPERFQNLDEAGEEWFEKKIRQCLGYWCGTMREAKMSRLGGVKERLVDLVVYLPQLKQNSRFLQTDHISILVARNGITRPFEFCHPVSDEVEDYLTNNVRRETWLPWSPPIALRTQTKPADQPAGKSPVEPVLYIL